MHNVSTLPIKTGNNINIEASKKDDKTVGILKSIFLSLFK